MPLIIKLPTSQVASSRCRNSSTSNSPTTSSIDSLGTPRTPVPRRVQVPPLWECGESYITLPPPLSLPLPLSGLPADIKWLCEKLKRLDVSHNRLHCLPDTFSDLRRLNVLMLSHNSLQELPPSCSWGCINLVRSHDCHVIVRQATPTNRFI